jgi:hypothetical protein
MFRGIAKSAALTALLLAGSVWAQPSKAANSDVVKDFEGRVKRYLDQRTQQAGTSPRPTNSSVKLAETQQQMAERIRAARAGARQGDIFTPTISEYFRRRIAATLSGPQGKRILASLRRAEPVKAVDVRVNAEYPQSKPLQSTPPTLLLNLPELPKELQYRIVGSSLILYDTAPNIVVDYIPHALPQQ